MRAAEFEYSRSLTIKAYSIEQMQSVSVGAERQRRCEVDVKLTD